MKEGLLYNSSFDLETGQFSVGLMQVNLDIKMCMKIRQPQIANRTSIIREDKLNNCLIMTKLKTANPIPLMVQHQESKKASFSFNYHCALNWVSCFCRSLFNDEYIFPNLPPRVMVNIAAFPFLLSRRSQLLIWLGKTLQREKIGYSIIFFFLSSSKRRHQTTECVLYGMHKHN